MPESENRFAPSGRNENVDHLDDRDGEFPSPFGGQLLVVAATWENHYGIEAVLLPLADT